MCTRAQYSAAQSSVQNDQLPRKPTGKTTGRCGGNQGNPGNNKMCQRSGCAIRSHACPTNRRSDGQCMDHFLSNNAQISFKRPSRCCTLRVFHSILAPFIVLLKSGSKTMLEFFLRFFFDVDGWSARLTHLFNRRF